MMRTLFVLAISLVPVAASGEPLRIMSFNIRYGTANDGDNRWENRKELVVRTVQQFDPDVMGTQETLALQADYLKQHLKHYQYFGRSRMKTPNEQCGIFYKGDRFTWLAGGHFWLSETPEVPESKDWDSSLPRMASWVLLRDKASPGARPLLFVNTHFDHRGRQAREASARIIRRRIDALRGIATDPHIVVTGDFNTGEASGPYKAFLDDNAHLYDTFRAKHPTPGDNEGTFNGFRGRAAGARIDWILASPSLETRQAAIDRYAEDGRYPSDHFPVSAVLEAKH